ncbi:hypothetical protein [Floridanema evergladense]|uniref:Uncharacterized protein n=1 Tax=Floridaenema evergladense BLCC-F167 TaxID=3153639 RepID=A0ABV4WWJ0_9CYAN
MYSETTSDPVRKEALTALTAKMIEQGCPDKYAPALAASAIFQTDLDLRNAQLSRLLSWLKQDYSDIHELALKIVEKTRAEFEHRVIEG